MKPLYWTRILIPYQPPQIVIQDSTDDRFIFAFSLLFGICGNKLLFFSSTLWEKLEEIAPDSWDDFADLFSRQVVAAKPVKPKTESKPAKQQTVKSTHFFIRVRRYFSFKELFPIN